MRQRDRHDACGAGALKRLCGLGKRSAGSDDIIDKYVGYGLIKRCCLECFLEVFETKAAR